MAEWSEFSKGSSLNCLEPKTFSAFRGNDGCLVEDGVDSADHDKAKQKSLFCQIFSVYVKENGSRGNVRPVPALLGDGQLLDLYQLFSVVKERGGYDAVSRKGLWDSVIAELGLDLQVLSSVKLVYDRYLSDFESWLSKTIEEKSFKNGNHGLFKSLPLDLEKEFRSLLCSNLKDKKDDDFVELESSNIIKHIDLVNQKSDGFLLDTKNRNNKSEGVQHVDGDGDDDDENFSKGVKDDLAAACVEISGKEFNSRKRKREELSGMVNWMRHVAKYPLEPVAQPIPEPSKWKEYKGHGFFPQILRARDARSVRKHTEPNSGSSSQV